VIYLDHNSTTPPTPGVVAAVQRGLTELWANPSSVHRAGQAARHAVELARQSTARLLGVPSRAVVFTGGGTEAIDLAIRGALASLPPSADPPLVLTTPTEHAAVRELVERLRSAGLARLGWLALTQEGLVDLADLKKQLHQRPAMLSVQWANNETGVIQPIHQIARMARDAGALVHTDATQWVGKEPVTDPEEFDFITCAPHKYHGPKGVGVLAVRRGVRFTPMLLGSQELGRRGGTENVPGILGAGVAAEEAIAFLEDPARRLAQAALRDRFERTILNALPECRVNAVGAPRLWNTTNIAFPRLEAEALLIALSERGVSASAGAACSSGSLDPSPVLLAMGIAPELAHGSLRFSLGRETTPREIDDASRIVIEAARSLGSPLSHLAPYPSP
jgi:cysteine desulfurase